MSNTWRATWRCPSWQSLLKRDLIDGVWRAIGGSSSVLGGGPERDRCEEGWRLWGGEEGGVGRGRVEVDMGNEFGLKGSKGERELGFFFPTSLLSLFRC